MTEFKKHTWEEYEKMLENFGYTPEQILAVKEIRENPEIEEITKEQFDYLVSIKVIERKCKLKKIRSLYVVGDNVVFLSHYHKGWQTAGYFLNEE